MRSRRGHERQSAAARRDSTLLLLSRMVGCASTKDGTDRAPGLRHPSIHEENAEHGDDEGRWRDVRLFFDRGHAGWGAASSEPSGALVRARLGRERDEVGRSVRPPRPPRSGKARATDERSRFGRRRARERCRVRTEAAAGVPPAEHAYTTGRHTGAMRGGIVAVQRIPRRDLRSRQGRRDGSTRRTRGGCNNRPRRRSLLMTTLRRTPGGSRTMMEGEARRPPLARCWAQEPMPPLRRSGHGGPRVNAFR